MPVLANSNAYINRMGSALPLRSDFGSGTYAGGLFGMPYVKVPGTQTKYPVTFRYYQESDPGPYPMPLNAPIQGGSSSSGDRHAIALDTTNCMLYELFGAFPQATSWSAGSGAVFNLKSNALRPDGWTSADAAGLPIFPGILRYDEIAAGEVRHAIRVVASQTQKAYVWPARHHASSITDKTYPPMGTRLRLRADFDITPYTPENQIILRGLKKYGLIIADNGASWFFHGEPDPRWNNTELRQLMNVKGSDFEAVDVSSLMIDPDSGQAKQSGAAVAVAPASATVVTQATRQFTANQTVTWLVNGVKGGNSEVGYVDSKGLYSAPGSVPKPATVQLQAKSSTSTDAAAITIRYPAPVISSISPASVNTGGITLTVNGTGFHTGAVVKLNGASLTTTFNSSAKLTATGAIAAAAAALPVTVTNPDGQVSAPKNLAVTKAAAPAPAPAITISITPASTLLPSGNTTQFTATVSNTTDKRVTWKVNGVAGGTTATGTISTTGQYKAPSSAVTATITATSVADPSKVAQATARVLVIQR